MQNIMAYGIGTRYAWSMQIADLTLVSLPKIARQMQRDIRTLRAAALRGEFPAVRIGDRLYVTPEIAASIKTPRVLAR